jgi:selenocysteine lyase/cysteine desulfurase
MAFEDGTPHFLAFDAIHDGLDWLDRIGMTRIASHVRYMTALLLGRLVALVHPDGRPMVEVYGPGDGDDRGGTVSLNVLDSRGTVVPFDEVVASAARQLVSVRGGCFCNPGCAEAALDFPSARAHECREALGSRYTPDRFSACIGGPVGAVRVSVGIPTIEEDIDRLIRVLAGYRGASSGARADARR